MRNAFCPAPVNSRTNIFSLSFNWQIFYHPYRCGYVCVADLLLMNWLRNCNSFLWEIPRCCLGVSRFLTKSQGQLCQQLVCFAVKMQFRSKCFGKYTKFYTNTSWQPYLYTLCSITRFRRKKNTKTGKTVFYRRHGVIITVWWTWMASTV